MSSRRRFLFLSSHKFKRQNFSIFNEFFNEIEKNLPFVQSIAYFFELIKWSECSHTVLLQVQFTDYGSRSTIFMYLTKVKIFQNACKSHSVNVSHVDQWMYNIHGYYDRRKVAINLGCNFPSHLLVGPFVQQEGRGWVKEEDGGDRYFSLLHSSLFYRT